MPTKWFFSGWEGLARTLVVGVLAYTALMILLRISGKRTLSKMNAFDLIVTVAFGSTLASVLLSKDVPLVDGVTAFGLLIALQFIITWMSVRSDAVDSMVKAEPALLYFRGQFQHQVMKRERVTESEVRSAARSQGLSEISQAAAIVLETDGSMTVITGSGDDALTTLKGVAKPEIGTPNRRNASTGSGS
jgi:uncharacterized membrane protein YcaP (DUF421 family)